jgi:hypothetical protein
MVPLTDEQLTNLWIGRRIRNIACVDRVAFNHFSPEGHKQIRSACDSELLSLGRESITMKEHRIFNIWLSGNVPTRAQRRFQKL